MTARLSVRWAVAVGLLSLFLTAVISGTVLAVLGYPVAGKVKDTLGKAVGMFFPSRSADTAASGEVERLRAQVESLQAQLDNARRQLQRERSQSSRISSSGTPSPGTNPNGAVPGAASGSGIVPPSNAGGNNSAGMNPAGGTNSAYPAVPTAGQDISQVYAAMSPSKAAAILQQMPPQDAVAALEQLSNEDRAAILEKMNPKTAATLIQMMGRAAH